MNRIIQVKVSGDYLTKDTDQAGTQHEANASRLRITFDESWDNYTKSVTFWDARGANPVTRVLTVDLLEDITKDTRVYLCPIPGEPMAVAGKFQFVIEGYLAGRRQRAVGDVLRARPAPRVAEEIPSADPTPTQAQQIQGQIDAVMESIRRAIEAANSADAAFAVAQAAQEVANAATAEAAEATQAAQDAKNAVVSKHASRHAAGGDDVITPAMIGAATAEAAQVAHQAADYAYNTSVRNLNGTVSGSLSVVGNAGVLNLIGTDHVYLPMYKNGAGTKRSGYIGYGDGNAINMTIANEEGGSLDLRSEAGLMINGYKVIHEGMITKSTVDIGEGVAMVPGGLYIVYE